MFTCCEIDAADFVVADDDYVVVVVVVVGGGDDYASVAVSA